MPPPDSGSDRGPSGPRSRIPSLSLFYPMHNEEGNIDEAVRRALRVLPDHADRYEVILVDDGSRDRTGELADAWVSRHPDLVRAVHHETNRGYGGALQSGIRASRYDWIFYTDGDNQFDLEELPLLLAWSDRYEIVSGYRRDRRDPLHRKLNAGIWNLAVKLLFRIPGRDVDCAFKLYRADVVRDLPLKSRGALIDVEIYARARRRGARIKEVPVHHYPRTHGTQSGAQWAVILRAGRELLALARELRS